MRAVEAAPSRLALSPFAAPPPGIRPEKPVPDRGYVSSRGSVAAGAPPRPLRLARYAVPERDADLPASVMAIRPVDTEGILFALSQKRGFPLLRREGEIPGRVPAEMAAGDAAAADYALLVRFAAVRSFSGAPQGMPGGGVGRTAVFSSGPLLAAGPARGVGALGPGPPPPASPPRPAYGASPGDFARGYEGMSPIPGDPWHREADFRDSGYRLRHGPPPAFAAPPQVPVRRDGGPVMAPYNPTLPKPPLPGDSDPPGRTRSGSSLSVPAPEYLAGAWGAAADDDAPPAVLEAGVAVRSYLLEIDCYALDPSGSRGAPIWRCRARQDADPAGLPASLAGMISLCLG
jgi:hypothetical protein